DSVRCAPAVGGGSRLAFGRSNKLLLRKISMRRVLPRLSIWLLSCQVLFGAANPASAQRSLDAMLRPYLARYELPALAAAVVVDGKVIAVGGVGTRKAGVKIAVTVDDRFHLGSDTKAMTALLAGMFVDAGALRWNSTIADVFPELAEQ